MADKQATDAKKQKIMIGVTVVIFLFIGWQVMGMFGGGSTPTITPVPAPNNQQAMNGASAEGGAAKAPDTNNAPTGQNPQPTGSVVSAPANAAASNTLQMDPTLLNLQRENEAKYVKALNELQMLKIQREIAETNEAITKSKLDTVKSEQSISDILVRPAAPTVIVPEGAYANNLVTPAMAGQSVSGISNRNAQASVPADASYVVLSVSRQDQRWTAVLGHQGKLYSVNVGDSLPADGSQVMSISKNAVMLKKDGTERKISISTAI